MGGRRMSSKKWRPKAATGKWQTSLPGAKPRAAAVYSPRSSSLESRMHTLSCVVVLALPPGDTPTTTFVPAPPKGQDKEP
ncbi:IQ motif and ankyrin repeat domain-containing protein 1 [Equus przewalskii]|uniref:IQ motif and ankyrin repeat domain-containing protein 1 n=1 Tax=Equus przewalskii TaxID=9798 RepID=A0ABM4QFY4_EQUPR